MASSKRKRRLAVTAVIVAGYVAGTIVAVKQGYSFGRSVPVRCRQGHLFTTTWIPGASLKALRLGLWRSALNEAPGIHVVVKRCPWRQRTGMLRPKE